ncbi:MAG: glycine dehydrogenase (aminomethyl-transferring) [Legionellales bacterium RIFCSPHIGHO2_12_FULL_35_11]|nr:MAG: glycine dehydrogenase (aminomethyl-transferring) [Legionellales bacterium RIFCSPHIGHO2_12_FULL_35_11]
MPYIPHTAEDEQQMLAKIGVEKIDDLFAEIPSDLQLKEFTALPPGLSEMEMLSIAENLSGKNKNGKCFLGAGSYDHYIPAAVWDIASRGEFLTSYTPYQAEVSQGNLQLVYEFQTMIAELTGMDVANASMYDGASALAEAILMAVRINKNSLTKRVMIAGTIHPFYLETVKTIVSNQQIEIITLPFNKETGITDLGILEKYENDDITALVIQQPNFFGCLEMVDELTNWASHKSIVRIACVNPTSLASLKPPSDWGDFGVDIVCGEGQPLGAPIASGGPYVGFFSTKMEYVRQMPGRLIGKTCDVHGKPGYALTLQAREQHIRRSKATSNICTNQGLLVTVATIYMSLLGADGLQEVAKSSHHNTHFLVDELTKISGVDLVFSSPFFHEAVIKLSKNAAKALEELSNNGILGGYLLENSFADFKDCILVCATEKRTIEDISMYVDVLKHYMVK